MSDVQIITTADGSHSLLNTTLNETYHSVHGALQESLHVFIKEGLKYCAEQNKKQTLKILEVGFGTGLNALLTLSETEKQALQVHYTSIEAFPLGENIWTSLNYATTEALKNNFKKLHTASWDELIEISNSFSLFKIKNALQHIFLQPQSIDLIYYDAFAPAKQPEMWELPLLEKVISSLVPGGVFVTYCAKGQLKRDLKSLGLLVQTLAGPPGKKEMVRAIKF